MKLDSSFGKDYFDIQSFLKSCYKIFVYAPKISY